VPVPAPKAVPASKWAVESESESDDEARVVRTAKEKRWEAMNKAIGEIHNHLKISDWSALQEGA
jgi:translation initiation factor 3 subunit C